MYYVPILALLIAVPNALLALHNYRESGGWFRKPGSRVRIRRIKHIKEVSDELGPDDCPDEVTQELGAARRDLAALYAVTTDINERDVQGNALLFGTTLGIFAGLLTLQPTFLGKILGIVLYLTSITFLVHVFGARRRWKCRQLLYGRFGGRADTPELPPVSRWPFVSRHLSQTRLNAWLNRTLGAGKPRPPEDITTEEIAELTELIEQWHTNPWWRRTQRAGSATTRVARRAALQVMTARTS
ncbi:hypothetical protein [Nocardia sp. NBC_01327]|uniref:hypothetical protein n=1 Tax=Nocardia sp. NBC_01327 TaxID=2903593 RepID=UPI002E165A0C|nr:hypothetical protein OG326_21715 [Nocardia sp. NBC_01327]